MKCVATLRYEMLVFKNCTDNMCAHTEESGCSRWAGTEPRRPVYKCVVQCCCHV